MTSTKRTTRHCSWKINTALASEPGGPRGAAWVQVAERMTAALGGPPAGRSAKQCRSRWVDVLDPETDRGPFTAQEDAAIVARHAYADACTLPCGHTFCHGCVHGHFDTVGHACPRCKVPWRRQDITPAATTRGLVRIFARRDEYPS